MSTAKLEVAIWVLVFGGLALLGLGLAVQRSDTALGWCMVGAGAIVAAIGGLMIVVRSRRPDHP